MVEYQATYPLDLACQKYMPNSARIRC